MQPRVLVPIANGSEEIEVCTIVDVLRRAGAEVVIGSANTTLEVTLAHGLKVVADKILSECVHEDFAMIALPGGMPGAEHLRDNADLTMLLKKQHKAGLWIGAICASPSVVLAHHALLEQTAATSYPGFENALPDKTKIKQTVVVDKKCVTGKSPGTAIEFALTLVAILFDEAKSQQIRRDLVLQ